jgi:hypothetical protein
LREAQLFSSIFWKHARKSAKINKNRNEMAEKNGKVTKYVLTKCPCTDMITSEEICTAKDAGEWSSIIFNKGGKK